MHTSRDCLALGSSWRFLILQNWAAPLRTSLECCTYHALNKLPRTETTTPIPYMCFLGCYFKDIQAYKPNPYYLVRTLERVCVGHPSPNSTPVSCSFFGKMILRNRETIYTAARGLRIYNTYTLLSITTKPNIEISWDLTFLSKGRSYYSFIKKLKSFGRKVVTFYFPPPPPWLLI